MSPMRSMGRLLSAFAGGVFVLSCGKSDAPAKPVFPEPPPVCNAQPARPAPSSQPITVVHVDASIAAPVQLAVQACAGLRNRKAGGSVFVDADPHDLTWLGELGLTPATTVEAQDFLNACVAEIPACVRYDYETQRALLPNILTAAAALGAVPLDQKMAVPCASPAFDALVELADANTPALATQYVFEKFGSQTTGLAMLDPGYDPHPEKVSAPAITQDMKGALVDFVFSQRLFVVFLVNGCIDGNPEKAVLADIVKRGHWANPLPVYGYNDSWNVLGGDLYEAQTLCLDSRNMGAVASTAGNLSFFSTRSAPITGSGAVVQNQPERLDYDPSQTYVAFVIGDGDNIQYIETTRRDWFEQRLADCKKNPATCLPLTWTISPHLARLAPDLLGWYYARSHESAKDYFVLPPSGHLYAYPSSMAEDAQNEFAKATENDACVLGLHGVVHWDMVGTWHDAEDHFLPKYVKGGAIRGVFPVNVPFAFPTFDWWPDEQFFEVLANDSGGAVALFKPREWRGVTDDGTPTLLSPKAMADELGAYPRGTVTWVYMTSDGGLTLENSFLALSKLLPDHVKLVSTDMAAKLAIESKQ